MNSRSLYGKMPDGREVYEYKFAGPSGIILKVIPYGAIITELSIADNKGNFENIILCYDSLEKYLNQKAYFGAAIGRFANRIAHGKFSLDGVEYSLAVNNGPNHLHGGLLGFDKVLWDVEEVFHNGIKFKYASEDNEGGYPGSLITYVKYLLKEDCLEVYFEASTDKPTIVNLTQHSYFNLSGSKNEKITEHFLQINAKEYLPVDKHLIPTGQYLPVDGSPFDFRKLKKIGVDIDSPHEQIKFGCGYDHTWVLKGEGYKKAATLFHPSSGRQLEIFTTEPGIQFYSGNWLDDTMEGKDNLVYSRRHGLALETQHFPDSPNKSNFPSTLLKPGQKFKSTTVYKFSVK